MHSGAIPTKFDHYKQDVSDGACELYAMIFGFMHTRMRDEFESNIQVDENGNVTLFFNYFNQSISVSNEEIQAIITKKESAKKHKNHPKDEIIQYHPSFHPLIIAVGLAYEKAMHLLQEEKLSESNKELLGVEGYGSQHGYAVTHQDFFDLNEAPGSTADLILNKQVDYLPMDSELMLGTDGSIGMVENNKKKTYAKPADEVFIICPENNHAVLYYYEKGSWWKFNNQTNGLDQLSKNFKLKTSSNKEPIRIVSNTEFGQNEPLWVLQASVSLIKYYSYTNSNGTCYDGQRDFIPLQKEKAKRFYPDEYLIATILNKYLSSQSSRINASSKRIVVLTEEWGEKNGRNGGANTGYINQKIVEAIIAASEDTETLILVPFLYGYHHPGIAIQVTKKDLLTQVNAIYLDPFGDKSSKYHETNNLRNILGSKGVAFRDVETQQQKKGIDGTSCGPILTFSMIKFIEEFLAKGEITTEDFEEPRKRLATDRLFQMYINNTQAVEEGKLGINEIMLADESLWQSVFSEQQLNDIPKQKILWLVSKQEKFIFKLKNLNPNDSLNIQKIQSIRDFQSQLTELIFINPPDMKNKINILTNEANRILNAKKTNPDLHLPNTTTNLLEIPYLAFVHKKLRLNSLVSSIDVTLDSEDVIETNKPSLLNLTDTNEVINLDTHPDAILDEKFEEIKKTLVESKPFQDLVSHMAGSIKWRQINAYLIGIKSATTMEDLVTAVRDDPRDITFKITPIDDLRAVKKEAEQREKRRTGIESKFDFKGMEPNEQEYKYKKSMRENTGNNWYGSFFFQRGRSRTEQYALELEDLMNELFAKAESRQEIRF